MARIKNEWQSDHQPIEIKFTNQVPKLLKLPVPVKLGPKLLDAIVCDYEFTPKADLPLFTGMKLTICPGYGGNEALSEAHKRIEELRAAP